MTNSCNTAYESVTDDLTGFFMLAKCGQKRAAFIFSLNLRTRWKRVSCADPF